MNRTLKAGVIAAVLGTASAGMAVAQCGVIVFFDSGQAGVGSAATGTLSDFIAANPGAQVSVTGYSDAAGSADANQRLSQRRAEAVASVLRTDVGATVASVTGVGEATRPDTSGPDDPRNRRVEVVDTSCAGGLFASGAAAGAGALAGTSGLAVAAGIGGLGLLAAAGNGGGGDGSGGSTGSTGN